MPRVCISNKAKKLFLNKNKRLYCKLCKNFINAHHIKQISEMNYGSVTNIEDIKILCFNCYRMAHRGIERCIDLDEIKHIIK